MPLSLKYLTFMSAIGGFLFGYDTSVISGALILIDEQFELTDVQEGLIVSITVLGAWVASLVSGKLADYCGRRPIVLLSSIIFTVGSAILAIASDFNTILVGRFIVGVGVGAASMCMPTFLGEIAPPESRGAIVTCINVACTMGQFISCLVSGSLSYYQNGWRYMFGIAALPAIIQFCGFMLIPESPRWLISQQREAEAEEALRAIRPEHEDISAEFSEMLSSVMGKDQSSSPIPMTSGKDTNLHQMMSESESSTSSASHELNLYSFWTKTNLFRALVLGCSIQACQQLVGINTVMYYSATIMRQAGFDSRSAIWLSAGTSFCNFVGSLVGLSLVDKLGRRPLTLSSLLGVVSALGIISVAFYNAEVSSQAIPFDLDNPSTCREYSYCFDCIQDSGCGFCNYGNKYSCVAASSSNDGDKTPSDDSYCPSSSFYGDSCPGSKNTRAGWLIFTAVCVYLLCFGSGMGCMPWCYNAEIYPTSVRGLGNSIATSCNWMFNFLVSLTFLQLVTAMNEWGAFLLYTSVGFAFLVYFAKYMPETKGIALEDVDKLFSDELWGQKYHFRNCIYDCGGFFGVTNSSYHDVGAQSASSTSSAPSEIEHPDTISNPLVQ